jgi:hypothetical protein
MFTCWSPPVRLLVNVEFAPTPIHMFHPIGWDWVCAPLILPSEHVLLLFLGGGGSVWTMVHRHHLLLYLAVVYSSWLLLAAMYQIVTTGEHPIALSEGNA